MYVSVRAEKRYKWIEHKRSNDVMACEDSELVRIEMPGSGGVPRARCEIGKIQRDSTTADSMLKLLASLALCTI